MTNVTFFKANPIPVQYRGHEEAKETPKGNNVERGSRKAAL